MSLFSIVAVSIIRLINPKNDKKAYDCCQTTCRGSLLGSNNSSQQQRWVRVQSGIGLVLCLLGLPAVQMRLVVCLFVWGMGKRMDGAVPGPRWRQASGGWRSSGPGRPTPAGWAGSSRRREHIPPLSLRALGPLGRGARTLRAGSRAPQSGTCVYGKSTVIHIRPAGLRSALSTHSMLNIPRYRLYRP